MNFFARSILLCLALGVVLQEALGATYRRRSHRGKKCFMRVGCFGIEGDFDDGQERLLPSSRKDVGTTFRLYSRRTPPDGLAVDSEDEAALRKSGFDSKLPLKFVIHGYKGDGTLEWMLELVRAYLKHHDVSVILVNWQRGSGFPYIQAAANARLAGREVALMVAFLQNKTGIALDQVHLIGFSLGAHVAGYAGKMFPGPKIGRITGLDPAGPFFELAKSGARLHKEDAQFVDVVHTNGGSILQGRVGLIHAVGHADFFVNGGSIQKGCVGASAPVTFGSVDDIIGQISCSHYRAVHIFKHSILSAGQHTAYACSSYEKFKRGECLDCAAHGSCVTFGHRASKTRDATTKFYMDTGSSAPFSGLHMRVDIAFRWDAGIMGGRFFVSLNYKSGKTSKTIALPSESGWLFMHPRTTAKTLALLSDAEGIRSLNVRWERQFWLSQPSSWKGEGETRVSNVAIFNAVTKKTTFFTTDHVLRTKRNYVFTELK